MRLRGVREDLPEPARYAAVGCAAVMFEAVGGSDLAVETLTRWSGRSLDPRITGRPVPELFMPDGAGHVAVLTRITGTRPDGRSFDDTQILYFQLEDGRVHSVDQFIGDPPAVTAFWA